MSLAVAAALPRERAVATGEDGGVGDGFDEAGDDEDGGVGDGFDEAGDDGVASALGRVSDGEGDP
ncbi:hypothetical protein DCAR_0831591 [Daucus carota subsp. sativus]|uniref:Uncharacterized protein n=1 Tax=Daucus carota subsp. sativus TaxID=79200 RepID=A0A175YPG1_DAUCS|nr:hypothetical protein DCAR_0831591 [Daucus carota subsp. sativus]